MSKFEYVDLADPFAARVRYVPARDRRGASRPGLDALVIGGPEGTALVLEGGPDQLRAFVAEMAAQLPPAGNRPRARTLSASREAPAGSQQAGPTHCSPCGAEIEEEDTGLWETGGDTADQRRYCTESRDHLHHPGDGRSLSGSDTDYGGECIIELASGATICTDSYASSPEGSTYVRVCAPDGTEAGYWTSDEWREDPGEVMGAILGAAKNGG